MKISVITPSLNQGKFIERTILSVLGQEGDFELEYIVVDGGSTDDTLDIIKRYQGGLRWVSEKDQGQSDAINKGIAMASGELLAWLNSDDTYEPDALSEIAETYMESKFDWCFGNCRNIDENDHEIRKFITRYKIFDSRRYSFRRLLSRNFVSQPTVFFTKKLYQKIGPLDLNCHYAMDYDYWLRIGKRCSPLYVDKFLADFRWHKDSKCSRNYKKAAYEAYLLAKRHAASGDRYPVLRHFAHYLMLNFLYKFL